MREFSIDEAIVAGYRRRADSARAVLRDAYDRSRALRAERDELLATASRAMSMAEGSARRTSSDPVDFLHSEDRARLKRALSEIESAAADERAAEEAAGQGIATAGRVMAHLKKVRGAADAVDFAAAGERKPAPPNNTSAARI